MDVDAFRGARTILRLLVAAVSTVAASCAALSQPAPDKALFAIDAGQPPATVAPVRSTSNPATTLPGACVPQVRRLRVASPYDGREFVYRTRGDQFRTDYYNGFIAAPDQLLTASLIAWLSRTGPFESVVDSSSGISARYVLEGNVTGLYGDYADKAAPKAFMAMRIFLLDDGEAGSRIIFQTEYHAEAPIELGSAESLVKGWENAFRQILERLAADLRAKSMRICG